MGTLSRPRVVAKQHLADVAMPEQVTLSLADLTRSAKEHVLAFSVALGLKALGELMEADLVRLVGPKGRHRADRTAYRHGSERRSVTLGGRLAEVDRPRARTRAGQELPLPSYEAALDRDLLTEAALGRSHASRRIGAPAAEGPRRPVARRPTLSGTRRISYLRVPARTAP